MAAKASSEAWICFTFFLASSFSLLLPVAPGYYRTVAHCNESMFCRKTAAYVNELVLYVDAAPAAAGMSPGNDGSIKTYGSKSRKRGLDLTHVYKLLLHSTAVASVNWAARMAAKAPLEAWMHCTFFS